MITPVVIDGLHRIVLAPTDEQKVRIRSTAARPRPTSKVCRPAYGRWSKRCRPEVCVSLDRVPSAHADVCDLTCWIGGSSGVVRAAVVAEGRVPS